MTAYFQNNDNGAVYDSGEVNLFQGLAGELYALPANQTAYSSLGDLVADWNVSIRGPPTGEVYNGWSADLGTDGQIDLSNNDFWYDTWGATQQTPNLDTMALTVSVPKSQLELDGIAGYNPETDAKVVIGVDSRPDAFVGSEGLDSWSATGNNYHVVPEPMTSLLLIAGAAAAGAKRAYKSIASYFRK